MRNFLAENFGLQDTVALVTGGREGIGGAISLALASAGANVVIATRRPEAAAALVKQCRGLGVTAEAVAMDLTRTETISDAVRSATDAFGRIDILVNNAAVPLRAQALDTAEAQWDEVLDTNLKGSFLVSQNVGRLMMSKGYGKIVNIASTYGVVGRPGRAAYAASKGGVIQLTKVLALEWAPYGILVNAVAPATVLTPSRAAHLATEEDRERRAAQIPLGRLGTPQDVVGAVVFLAGHASDFITGATLMVDGGWTAQ